MINVSLFIQWVRQRGGSTHHAVNIKSSEDTFLLTQDGDYVLTQDGYRIRLNPYAYLLTQDGRYVRTQDGERIKV